jgi:hypothetical protein
MFVVYDQSMLIDVFDSTRVIDTGGQDNSRDKED